MIARFPVLALLILFVGAMPVAAQDPSLPMPPVFLKTMEPMVPREAASENRIVTRHTAKIHGKQIAYRAIVTEMPIANAEGNPAAVVASYAYVAEDTGKAANRPVLFIFNGGPGASSSPLHLSAFGPRRIVHGETKVAIADNRFSLLDVADLVFIDPPGTGASMPIAGADPSSLFSVEGDANAIAEVVRRWRQTNDRTKSPYALMGESYGTLRALAMLDAQAKAGDPLPDGVALLSLAIGGSSGPVISDVVLLPTLAATAWYHGAIDRNDRTLEAHFNEALAFSRGDYASARLLGAQLPQARRDEIAKQMAALIGLPADVLGKNLLKLDGRQFMLNLLADKGLRTGQLDARTTRLISESNMHPPFDDPSMRMGTENGVLLEDYLTGELDYHLPSPYRTLNLGINFKWNYGPTGFGTVAYAPLFVAARQSKPDIKLFTAGGLFDITTPAEAGLFALDQAGIGPDQRSSHVYAAGHSVFEDEAELAKLATDLRSWAASLVR